MATVRVPGYMSIPIGKGGAAVPGVMTIDSRTGVAAWRPKDGRGVSALGLIGDKDTSGNWRWRDEDGGRGFAEIARITGQTPAQVSGNLYNTPANQNALDAARRSVLDISAGAGYSARLGLPTGRNVAGGTSGNGTGGGDGGGGGGDGGGDANSVGIASGTQDQLLAQVVPIYRKNYGDSKYPLNFPSNQDCVKFTMIRYIPKKFENTIIGSTANEADSSKPLFADSQKEEMLGTVTLPIQSPISDNNTVSWSDDNLNAFMAEGQAAALQLATGSPIDAGAVTNRLQNEAAVVGSLVGIKLAEAATGADGGRLYTRLTGAIINPNIELLFTAPGLRSFSFTFKMSAREEDEATQIKNIIRFFKQGMSVKRAQSNLFLVSPNVFKIQYLYRGGKGEVDHPWINRIKTCALQSCSVNYTPEGNYATYRGGSMTSYEMTLNFGELTPIYDDDYGPAEETISPNIGY